MRLRNLRNSSWKVSHSIMRSIPSTSLKKTHSSGAMLRLAQVESRDGELPKTLGLLIIRPSDKELNGTIPCSNLIGHHSIGPILELWRAKFQESTKKLSDGKDQKRSMVRNKAFMEDTENLYLQESSKVWWVIAGSFHLLQLWLSMTI